MLVDYSTSLYIASISGNVTSTRKQVRDELWTTMRQTLASQQVTFDDGESIIRYNSTQIEFSVMDAINEKAYLLAFRPGGNVQAFGLASAKQSENVLDFCDLLGTCIQISTNPPLAFRRRAIASNDKIDISEWEVECPYSGSQKRPLFLLSNPLQ